MKASLRIRYPKALEKQKDKHLMVLSDDGSNETNDYLQRLVKLIPGEAIAMHLTIRNMVGEQTDTLLKYMPYVGLVVVLIVRILGTRVKLDSKKVDIEWTLVLISIVSYILWILAIGGWFPPMEESVQSPLIGIGILFWTFIVPYIYKANDQILLRK